MRSRVALAVAVVLAVALAAGGVWWWRQHEADRDAAARAALTAYAAAWATKDLDGIPFVDEETRAGFGPAVEGLGGAPVEVSAEGPARDGDSATADLAVRWTLPGGVPWSYAVPARVVESEGRWLVATPEQGSPWHPQLPAGETLELERTSGQRGDLLDRSGRPLMPLSTVHEVAIDPVNATPAQAAALEPVVDAEAGSLTAALARAIASGSRAPIPVITYRDSDWEPRRERIEALAPGVIAPTSQQPLARTRTFGQPLLGSVGEVTAEMVQEGGGRYVAGDRAGTGGLQGQYDERLAGASGIRVATSGGTTLFEQEATDGEDVRTTLDPRVQEAAEKALADADLTVPGALVAVDVPSGEVLASANTPTTGFDRAITGRYPPGSTFKVATAYAYLTRGITTPTSKVPCPESVTVDGREFRNYAGESVGGTPTFFQDFTVSCNTAFVGLSDELAPDDLTTAARTLGIGAGWADTLGVADAFDGSVPETTGGTDAAAASIGQGRVEVSPLSLAVMSGSVGRGTFVAPVLVDDGRQPRPSPIDGGAVARLRAMMASVVASGTGTELRGAPGGPVRGKTGSAEHGSDPDAEPRVWFTGYQGDVAFAVLVEEGKSGGSVAAPIARDFLTALAANASP
ncbi:penicillin-binding transpeptidase domain-containing protein [Fodinibacter luteus]|uniref:Penicillin-binding transpeptidase domain-containing protein n=1 Tax=Fodinibacter luteus TaxID=552064 RepID=A0ABP8KMS0_9MICO